jgi:hypothetical protein
MIWARRLARIRRTFSPEQPPTVSGDAVDLWRRIYATDPDPWQADVLRSRGARVLMNCCRQSGKSTVSAVAGLHEALSRPPALVLLLSASLRQAQELGRRLFDGYRALGKPVSPEAENRLSLELSNGSRILCLPAKEMTVRGYSGARLVVIDEAARVPDSLYYSLRPMLSVSQGRLMCLSTPFGKRGFFHQEWTQGQRWDKVQVTALECPRIPADFLEEERGTLPDFWFRQEYLCEFADTQTSVFGYDDILSAFSDRVKPLFDEQADELDAWDDDGLLDRTLEPLFTGWR